MGTVRVIIIMSVVLFAQAVAAQEVVVDSKQVESQEKCIYHGRGYAKVVGPHGKEITIKIPSQIKGYCLYYTAHRSPTALILFKEKGGQNIRHLSPEYIEKKEWTDDD